MREGEVRMAKIILLADLHGNMPATLAMEKEINRIEPDEIWFLGDAVGKGPESDQTCDWVRIHCQHFIGGNWDYGNSAPENQGSQFYRQQLGEERLRWLHSLPKEGELTVSGIRFRLFHGRPVTPLFQGSASDEYLSEFFKNAGKTFGGIICADSHRPYVRVTEAGYAINTGSVGNSLCVTKAHALLIEGEKDCEEQAPIRFTTLSVPYDNVLAAQIAEACKELPNQEAYIREVLTGVYAR